MAGSSAIWRSLCARSAPGRPLAARNTGDVTFRLRGSVTIHGGDADDGRRSAVLDRAPHPDRQPAARAPGSLDRAISAWYRAATPSRTGLPAHRRIVCAVDPPPQG